jgi:hypothetical protein
VLRPLLAAAAIGCFAAGLVLAQGKIEGAIRPLAAVPFAPDPDVACLASAIETGDAARGPSTWILKAPAGCVVPWHSHTAREQLIVVTGQVMAEMSAHPSMLLEAGGFAMMGGGMAHQFTCQGRDACVMFVTFDGPYDIKWGK